MALVKCGTPKRGVQNLVEFAPVPKERAIAQQAPPDTFKSRLAALDETVTRWQRVPNLTEVYKAAEETRNVIGGPAEPFYGDANRNKIVSGAAALGMFPGRKRGKFCLNEKS